MVTPFLVGCRCFLGYRKWLFLYVPLLSIVGRGAQGKERVSSYKMMESGLLEARQSLPKVFMESQKILVASSGKQDFVSFHGQATVKQHDPRYFGRLGILFIPPPATMGDKCSVLFVTGSSTYPEHFSCLRTSTWPLFSTPDLSTETDIQTQQKRIPKLMSAFHPPPHSDLASTYPQVMLLKRSNIKKWLSWGTIPKETPSGFSYLHLRESALVQQQTKTLPHLRKTHWLP